MLHSSVDGSALVLVRVVLLAKWPCVYVRVITFSMLRLLCKLALPDPAGVEWLQSTWQRAVNITFTAEQLRAQCKLVPASVELLLGTSQHITPSLGRSCPDCAGLICPERRIYINRNRFNQSATSISSSA